MLRIVLLPLILVGCANLGYQRIDTNHKVGGTANVNTEIKVTTAADSLIEACAEEADSELRSDCYKQATDMLRAILVAAGVGEKEAGE